MCPIVGGAWGTFQRRLTVIARLWHHERRRCILRPMTPSALIACALLTVHDGDTVRCDGELMRIIGDGAPYVSGVDTPELSPHAECPEEHQNYNGWDRSDRQFHQQAHYSSKRDSYIGYGHRC